MQELDRVKRYQRPTDLVKDGSVEHIVMVFAVGQDVVALFLPEMLEIAGLLMGVHADFVVGLRTAFDGRDRNAEAVRAVGDHHLRVHTFMSASAL